MESFVSRYIQRVEKTKSVLCVGLDPTKEHVPFVRERSVLSDMRNYLYNVIAVAAPLVPVVKFQIAYYASLGVQGEQMLKGLVHHAREKDLLVILDAKRADIGSTMEQYGVEVFDRYGADACTTVPYFGPTFNPSWLKWLKNGKMVIPMIRTSNPEAGIIQDLELKSGRKFYQQIAEYVAEWHRQVREATGGAGSVGGVVGATWPQQALDCRQQAGDDVFFLVPGYGTQGGAADGAVASLPNSRGELMGTVNSSRGITLNSWWDDKTKRPREGDPLGLVKKAIETANTDLNAALTRHSGHL